MVLCIEFKFSIVHLRFPFLILLHPFHHILKRTTEIFIEEIGTRMTMALNLSLKWVFLIQFQLILEVQKLVYLIF